MLGGPPGAATPPPPHAPCASIEGSQAGQPGGRAGGPGVRRTAGPATVDKGAAQVGPEGRKGRGGGAASLL